MNNNSLFVNNDPVLRLKEVCAFARISRPTLYRNIARGILPKPIVISAGLRGFRKSTIENYLSGNAGGNADA